MIKKGILIIKILFFFYSANLYRSYEKDRRSRFNANLDKLATLLPNYAESNNSSNKWTKCQIVENAIKHVQTLQENVENSNPNTENAKLMKILKKQNKKLREIVRSELVPHLSDKEFCSLDFPQLYEIIKKSKKSSPDTVQEPVKEAANDAGDVFVVSTENGSSADHTYSLIVQQEAEVEIGEEAPEEDVVILEQNDQVEKEGKIFVNTYFSPQILNLEYQFVLDCSKMTQSSQLWPKS